MLLRYCMSVLKRFFAHTNFDLALRFVYCDFMHSVNEFYNNIYNTLLTTTRLHKTTYL